MPTILITTKLNASQELLLKQASVAWLEKEFIQIETCKLQVEKQPVENAIITSKNTVKALLENNIKLKNAFCVGQKTKQALEEQGVKVIENTDYGADLAKCIAKTYATLTFTFFCGNLRRPELPNTMKAKQINFTEIQAYKTRLTPKKITQPVDAVLFFSPSGVQSFMEKNALDKPIAFCIGTTTAKEAQKHTKNILLAEKPTIDSLLQTTLKYYTA